MTMQSMCYQALFNGLTSNIGKDIGDGIFIFWIDTPDTLDYYNDNYSNGELYECFFTPRGKLAWDVLENAYSVVIVDSYAETTVNVWKIVVVIGCVLFGFKLSF